MYVWLIYLLTVFTALNVSALNYRVDLKSDSPIVKGATITFYATVYYGDSIASNENFKYEWEDNGIPQHSRQTDIQNATDSWRVTYNASIYPVGNYIAQVKLKKCIINIICYEIASNRIEYLITETLNGGMVLLQNNKTRSGGFVSNKSTVIHQIDLKKSDMDYISKAPTIFTYWFVDCTYYGITTDFKFPFNYSVSDEDHTVEALVMADFTPLPPTTTVPPSTTTIKPTSTTTTKPTSITTTTTAKSTTITTTTKPTTATTATTIKPSSITSKMTTTVPKSNTTISYTPHSNELPDIKSNVTSNNAQIKSVNKRSVKDVGLGKNITSRIMVKANGTLVPYNITFPFVCNSTRVATDSKKTYGYFYENVKVRAPISKVNVTGNNWIQPGDLLSLKVTCRGSKNMLYCVEYIKGFYNITGNETCFEYVPLDSCDFSIKRYLSHSKYTIVIIIKNDVSKVVTPVTVNIYKVNKQAQLSVIVVPVAFSLVAVVLIVFGVAYYIQNRSRFIVEVADFNFGQQYSDMEYKTFRERLKDSIVNAFTRGPSPSSSEVPVWPPGRKYGSMT